MVPDGRRAGCADPDSAYRPSSQLVSFGAASTKQSIITSRTSRPIRSAPRPRDHLRLQGLFSGRLEGLTGHISPTNVIDQDPKIFRLGYRRIQTRLRITRPDVATSTRRTARSSTRQSRERRNHGLRPAVFLVEIFGTSGNE
jgi:hypothetical protein